jgi:YrbI family 3-deoxy-D-manno-octulosonate 8-phosphate phosphatase
MKENKLSNKGEFLKLANKIKLIVFDFDGVFTDNRVLTMQDGSETVFCNRGDGLGIAMLKKTGLKLIVISTETNPVVKARCKKLGLSCICGCKNKLAALRHEAMRLGVSLKEAAYIGNDINDLECLRSVYLPIGVADSHPAIIGALKFVTHRKGGEGAVREVCDLIGEAKNCHAE